MNNRGTASGIVIGALLILLLPGAVMFAFSIVSPEGGISFKAYEHVLSDSRQIALFQRSVMIAGATTLLALAIGLPVGYAIARLPAPWAMTIAILCPIPLMIPSLVIALGWITLFGNAGTVTTVLQNMMNMTSPLFTVYGEAGTSIVMALCYFPCVALISAAAFRSVDARMVSAAELVASPARVFRSVILRLALGPIAIGAVLTFLLAFGDFGVPSVFGVNVYPIEIFTSFNAYHDFQAGIAQSLPPVLLAVVLMIFAVAIAHRSAGNFVGGDWRPIERWEKNRRSLSLFLFALLVTASSSLLPIALLVSSCGSLSTFQRAMETAAPQVIASFETALAACLTIVVVGATVALLLRYSSRRLRWTVFALLGFLLAIPASVTGMGILALHTRGWIPDAFYRSGTTTVIADVCRFAPFSILIIWQSLTAIGSDVEYPALLAGISRPRTALRILLPLSLTGVGAAAIVSFIFPLGELGASVLVNPAGGMTLPSRICSLLHFGEEGIVAALCLTICLLVLIPYTLGLLLFNRIMEFRIVGKD